MSSGFITESEAVEARKKRQEEWERVRKADDPIERPEEVYDHRSLFERLQEQKQKKDLEYEEAHKLKNMIKGLDDDEIEFLDLVDRTKLAADRKKALEEELELHDYRNRVANVQEKALEKKLQVEVKSPKPKVTTSNQNSQLKLLKGIVVKKSEKRKLSSMEKSDKSTDETPPKQRKEEDERVMGDHAKEEENSDSRVQTSNQRMQCIGILPGMGCYNDSSSEAESSSSDQEEQPRDPYKCDLFGRKFVLKQKKTAQDQTS